MPQLLNLSRAARLAGVTRGELQKKIRKGELNTFEGEIAINDLLRVYPNVELENNEMLDRVNIIKATAVPRTDFGDGAQPLPKVIATRLNNLNTTLARVKSALNASEDLVQEAINRLRVLTGQETPVDPDELRALVEWLESASNKDVVSPDKRARLFAKDAFLRIIAASVKVIPSGHEYFVEGTESILEAGLRAGLSMNYGCASGNCGSCKARVVSGEVWKLRDHDYVLGPTEQDMGYILTCCNTAVTDVVLEASEALSPSDLAIQEIRAVVRKVQPLDEDLMLLRLQTPRTQTLRFLAGQKIKLILEQGGSAELHLASCPCDGRNLEFLVRRNDDDAFAAAVFSDTAPSEVVTLHGPTGEFVLDDDSVAPVLLIALGDGISPIRSLVEHAISIDLVEGFTLYWLSSLDSGNYLDRLCRSWNDSLDNFRYVPLDAGLTPSQLTARITDDNTSLDRFNFYIAGPQTEVEDIVQLLGGLGVPGDRLRMEFVG
jgi:CDP-4-dehydro-6-deoxyglucose reductase